MPNTKNFGFSTVLTAPSPATSGTSLVVQSGDGTKFPTPPFNATVWPAGAQALSSNAEIVTVTAIVGDTLTITRQAESSSARTVIVGDQIDASITAGLFPVGTILGTSDVQVFSNKSSSTDFTLQTGHSLKLDNAAGNSSAYLYNNGASGASILQSDAPVIFTAPGNLTNSAVTTSAAQTLTSKEVQGGIVDSSVFLDQGALPQDETLPARSYIYPAPLNLTGGFNLTIPSGGSVEVADYARRYMLEFGWIPLDVTFTYASASSPEFTMTCSVDPTTFLQASDKLQVNQGGRILYFFVTKVTNNVVTLYGGTDYVLANATINIVSYSRIKSPFGFPMAPAKWTQTLSSANDRTTTSTSFATLTDALTVVTGSWRITFRAALENQNAGTGIRAVFASLSTSGTTETDTPLTLELQQGGVATNTNYIGFAETTADLAVATTYTLIGKVNGTSNTLVVQGLTKEPTLIRAICAYL